MLILSISIFIIGIAILILAVRGRVVQRGCFCKHCRFDLAGNDLDAEEVKCPECGVSVAEPHARSEIVRYWRPGLVWSGALASVLGAALLTISLMGGFGAIYTNLPTNSLLTLTEWGDEEALDEMVRRVGQPSATLSSQQWGRVIEHGLKLQADASIKWDWRWGELLCVALTTNQMSQDEIGQYFLNGLAPKLSVRTKAHPNARGIPNRLDITQNRMWAINDKPTNYVVTCHLVAFGEVGKDPVQKSEVREFPRPFNVSSSPGQQTGASFGGSGGIDHKIDREPGETARVYFDYVVRVRRLQAEETILDATVRKEFDIEFIDPAVPLVETVRDDALVQSLGLEMWCSIIQVPSRFPELDQFGMYNVLLGMVHSPSVREHLSLRLYLELDGEEIEVGKLNANASQPYVVGGQMWARTHPKNESEVEKLRLLHQRLLDASEVRIIARSDPTLAADEPDADQILGVEIIFDHVRIEIKENIPAYITEITQEMISQRPSSYRSFGIDGGGDAESSEDIETSGETP